RRRAEGAKKAGPGGSRNTASPGPSGSYGFTHPHGGDYFSAGSRVLSSSENFDEVINQTATPILDQFVNDVNLFHPLDDEGMSRHPDAGKTTHLSAAAKERRIAKKQR